MYNSGSCKLNRHWGHHEGRIHVLISIISLFYVTFLSVLIPQKIVVDWINVEKHCLGKTSRLWLWQCYISFVCVCVWSYIFILNIPLLSGKKFCMMRVGRTRCISSNWVGGGEPRNDCLLLHFPLHYMLSLHLLYKYKHSRNEHKKEKKNIQICNMKRNLIMHTFEK